MRIVFDTNVLVSALLIPDSKPRKTFDLALRQGQVLLSLATLAELSEVLNRKELRRYIDEEDVRTLLAAITREAHWVEVDVQVAVCRDPKDNKFLELAISGAATHIITGDRDLLALHPFRGIQIISPDALLRDQAPC